MGSPVWAPRLTLKRSPVHSLNGARGNSGIQGGATTGTGAAATTTSAERVDPDGIAADLDGTTTTAADPDGTTAAPADMTTTTVADRADLTTTTVADLDSTTGQKDTGRSRLPMAD